MSKSVDSRQFRNCNILDFVLQFLRMQGKNNRAESVDFIDFQVDDHRDKNADLKYLTVEKSDMVSKEEEKKFSKEQKSKHQIQYLAFMVSYRFLLCIG
jgi:pimeloyl-CoA synthetase